MQLSRYVPLVVALGTLLTGCDRGTVADPDFVAVESAGLLAACALEPERQFDGWIGVAGGTLKGNGVSMTIPPGALPAATHFRVRIPSSPYAEAEIHADGQEHYQFLQPVVIAIDYDRCGTPIGTLTAWHIDPDTHVLLENMGGVNDVINRRVSFSTMHLSGYAIAN